MNTGPPSRPSCIQLSTKIVYAYCINCWRFFQPNKSSIPNTCCEYPIIAKDFCSTKYLLSSASFRSNVLNTIHFYAIVFNVLSETKSTIATYFSNRNDEEFIMNYMQTIVTKYKLNWKKRYDSGIRTRNPHDSMQAIHPLCYDYLLVIGMCI